ncbi:MAG: DUF374 domain-containing protein [Fidelibacterota bacterium]
MFKLNYEVTKIPLWFKPFYYLSSYMGALLITFYRWGVLHSCTIHFEGLEFVKPYPSRIESIWHYKGPMYWLAQKNVDHYVQFSHPLWFMYKIILALRWQGVKVILGSAGHSGREAADKIVEEVKKGYACCITPDGPEGPVKVIKKGVLHMSMQSGAPIIPVRVECSHSFRIWYQWDKKRIPFFFSDITIRYQAPIFVSEENFSESFAQLAKSMGD